MSDTPTPDGLHLEQNGTARLVLGDTVVHLRRPTLAEYSDLADMSQDIDAEIASKRPRLVELNQLVTSGKAHDVQRAEARKLVREIQFAHQPIVERVVNTLGSEPIDFDSAAPWLTVSARSIVGTLFGHWETVPFHGSGTNGN